MFLETFKSFEEEDMNFYDMKNLLSVLFVLSNSSRDDKASALFDVLDINCNGLLSKFETDTGLKELIYNIYTYTAS